MMQLLAIFASVLIAELGDKTQVATLLFAANDRYPPMLVFAAAASALCLSSALAVVLGTVGARYLDDLPLNLIAGLGFIAIGAWSVVEHFRAS
jgi:putative Ca2+/H+ antiporter (TMEM165/GDT1 family)